VKNIKAVKGRRIGGKPTPKRRLEGKKRKHFVFYELKKTLSTWQRRYSTMSRSSLPNRIFDRKGFTQGRGHNKTCVKIEVEMG